MTARERIAASQRSSQAPLALLTIWYENCIVCSVAPPTAKFDAIGGRGCGIQESDPFEGIRSSTTSGDEPNYAHDQHTSNSEVRAQVSLQQRLAAFDGRLSSREGPLKIFAMAKV